jgi:hypothetical protein
VSDLAFVAAAYAVIVGGVAGYAWLLRRRLRALGGIRDAVDLARGGLDETGVARTER